MALLVVVIVVVVAFAFVDDCSVQKGRSETSLLIRQLVVRR